MARVWGVGVWGSGYWYETPVPGATLSLRAIAPARTATVSLVPAPAALREGVLAPSLSSSVTIGLVPAVVRDGVFVPGVVPGSVSVPLGVAALQLFGVAPTLSSSVSIAVGPSALRLLAEAPQVTASVTLGVSPTTLTLPAVSPALVPGTASVPVTTAALSLDALAPTPNIQVLMPASVLTFVARRPRISGGGGVIHTLPRKGGDSSGSLVDYDS